MSYTMTHLIIADQYRKRHNMPLEEANVFLLASICPDSIHACSDYSPDKKEKTHIFPSALTWGDIYKEEQMDEWYENVKEFYYSKKLITLTTMERAFLNGYLLHLVVDIFNCAKIYSPNLIKYSLDVGGFRRDYREQCLKQDQNLYETYEFKELLFEDMKRGLESLKKTDALKRLGLLGTLNMDIIQAHIERDRKIYEAMDPVDLRNTHMITKEITNCFIDEMGHMCDELLFDFPERKRIFKVS